MRLAMTARSQPGFARTLARPIQRRPPGDAMIRNCKGPILATVFLLLSTAVAAQQAREAKRQPGLEEAMHAMFAVHSLHQAEISPNGKLVAWVESLARPGRRSVREFRNLRRQRRRHRRSAPHHRRRRRQRIRNTTSPGHPTAPTSPSSLTPGKKVSYNFSSRPSPAPPTRKN